MHGVGRHTGEAIQEHERAANLSKVPKCPKDTSAPTQKVRHFGTKDAELS